MDYKIFQPRLKNLIFILFGFTAMLSSLGVLANAESLQKVNDDKILFEQAVELSLQSQWSQAEIIYRELIKRNKNWPEPSNNLAIILLKTNRIDEAKKTFEQAVSSSPSYKITQQNRTQLYNYLAKQAYDKVLGAESNVVLPELEFIQTINQSVKIIEKKVEKIIIQKEYIETPTAPLSIEKVNPENNKQKNISKVIEQQLLGWSRAWSQGDFERYLKIYSENFTPSDSRKTYTQWKNIRRARLRFTQGVNITIDQLRVFVEPENEYALVEFLQTYQSDSYSDKVLKQMYMHYQQGSWLILSERTIKNF